MLIPNPGEIENKPEPQFTQEGLLCQHANHMSAVWDNKIYTLGGYEVVLVANGSSRHTSTSYLRIYDFDSRRILKGAVYKLEEIMIPDEVPRIKWGSLWADEGKIYLYGGEYEIYPIQVNDKRPLNDTRALLDGQLWEYNIRGGSWTKQVNGHGSISWVTRGMSAFDKKSRIAYILGGVKQDYNSSSPYLLGNGTAIQGDKSGRDLVGLDLTKLLIYDMSAKMWTSFEVNDTIIGSAQQGRVVYIEALGTMGALVVLGGSTSQATSMLQFIESISIYDIGTNTWHQQNATAKDGAFPKSRKRFCAVAVSAADGSSHSIYVWGGASIDHQQNSLNDIWILTLPYFHWIKVGNSPVGRESMTCDLLSSKYIIGLGGRDGPALDNPLAPGPVDYDQGGLERGIMIFDITSLRWVHKYNTPGTENYKVPSKLYDIIGGNTHGSATINEPNSGFADHKMKFIFKRSSNPDLDSATPGIPVTEVPEDNTRPTATLAAGVSVGAVILIALLLAWFIRHRKLGKKALETHGGPQNETELDKIVDAFGGPGLGSIKRKKNMELRTIPTVREDTELPAISETLHLKPEDFESRQRKLSTGNDSLGRRSVFEENLGQEVSCLGGQPDMEIRVI